jgi:hypothetical protein
MTETAASQSRAIVVDAGDTAAKRFLELIAVTHPQQEHADGIPACRWPVPRLMRPSPDGRA